MPSHNLPRERRTPSQRCREGSCQGTDTGAALGPVNGAEPGKKGTQGQEATPKPSEQARGCMGLSGHQSLGHISGTSPRHRAF